MTTRRSADRFGGRHWTEMASYEAHWLLDEEPVELPEGWGEWDEEDCDTGALRGPRRPAMGEWGPYLQEPTAEELAWLEERERLEALEEAAVRGSAVDALGLRRVVSRGNPQWDSSVGAFVDVDPEPAWGFRATV